jgi:hypothetical protein
MLEGNSTLIYLDLGSVVGSQPNRFGKELGISLGRLLQSDDCLIQYLNLSGVTLSNASLQLFVEMSKNY